MPQLTTLTIEQLQSGLRKGEFSARELAGEYLKNIELRDDELGAYLSVTADLALRSADSVDDILKRGEELPSLGGIPCGIKDNICTDGVPTTCASKMLADFVPCYDATVIKQLKQQNVVMLGKLNMDEFAMGSSNENSAFKVVRNPVDRERVPGGSSGGSAAAVKANEAAFTLGSDTGGSIRQPAAFCGVVGMKPTYGSVSRFGLVAFASSLDQIGPLTKNVRDNALVLDAIACEDKNDATSIKGDRPSSTEFIGADIKGKVIGLPLDFFADGIDSEVKESVLNSVKLLESLGAKIKEVKLPNLKHALSAYYVISSAEASSNLARFDGIRYGYRSDNAESLEDMYRNSRSEGFGAEVQRRIMLGTFALSSGYYDAYYNKALQVRTLIKRDYANVFADCDSIISPVAPTTAYRLGEKTTNPLEMYLGDIYSVPINIAGLPAISLPCGTDSNGLPIGVQLIGDMLSEPKLYQLAYALEQAVGGVK